MNCANHPEITAVAFCRECGKPMCEECQRPALGSVYCAEHRPVTAAPPPPLPEQPGAASSGYASSPYSASASPYSAPANSPYAAPADPSVHPVLALILGIFPGVGAIYNGQYAKGL